MRGKGGTKPLSFIGFTCPVGRRPGGLGRTQARPCEHLLIFEGYANSDWASFSMRLSIVAAAILI